MKKIILTLLCFLCFTPVWSHTTEAYKIKLLEPIPVLGSATGEPGTIEGDDGVAIFAEYVSRIYNYAAFVAGIFCVAVIIFQGINVIMGGANNSFVSEAKDKIMQAIFSLILLLAAAMVLRLVNPNFYTQAPPPLEYHIEALA